MERREKVVIPKNKPFIYMKGDDNARSNAMIIDGSDNLPYGADRRNSTAVAIDETTFKSATFSVFADNFVAKRMTFRNMYNFEGKPDPNIQAVAAVVAGDMVAFYFCNFIGRQDTLCDLTGRHMYTKCGIQGTLDFIFGYATSTCYINLNGDGGWITANGRSNANDTTGFVFKYCEFTQLNSGSAYLGRAWGPYARSVLFHTHMENVIVPAGWDIGSFAGHENDMTFAELGCFGPGSNEYGNVSRVAWEKYMSEDQEKYYATDFNDAKKWRPQQP
ncbi:putative pectinesterase 29 [Acorus calamus]|uniref:Pectinesterase n=1 Tax=Acorus calamus TaxID=4465 RepID=A0AAV9F3M8_ACOCL|nr:putative pectinesterase 29 [Acorus calamus]